MYFNHVQIPGRGRSFSFLQNIQTGYGAHPASCSKGTGAPSFHVERKQREADHFPIFLTLLTTLTMSEAVPQQRHIF
jgi:hypothetical protein